jgi:phosphatidylglycerophosphate synthase
MAVRTEQALHDNLRSACARWAPDALSAARVLCGPAFVVAFASAGAVELEAPSSARAAAPLAIAAVACLTDFADGRLARWLGGGSSYGAALDVGADAVFLLCSLTALARGGLVSAGLPIAAALSLLALFTSRAGRSGADPGMPASALHRGAADLVGHGAGIANFAVVVAASAAHAGLASGGWLFPVSLVVAAANLAPILLRRFER